MVLAENTAEVVSALIPNIAINLVESVVRLLDRYGVSIAWTHLKETLEFGVVIGRGISLSGLAEQLYTGRSRKDVRTSS